MISEKIELLGKNLYATIPNVLTLKSIPTASELEYVGSEEFDKTMLDKILPQCIEEDINPYELLEIDYQWICRCLRLINYGPYHTVGALFCKKCGRVSGEYRVNLNAVKCKTLPDGFVNSIKISKSEFIDFNGDIVIKLPTIKNILNAYSDEAFNDSEGKPNKALARICYMIDSFAGVDTYSPIELKFKVLHELSSADYIVLKEMVENLTDYGLRLGGTTICPKCSRQDAAFFAYVDEKFFRPTMGDLKQWRTDRSSGGNENTTGTKKDAIRKNR